MQNIKKKQDIVGSRCNDGQCTLDESLFSALFVSSNKHWHDILEPQSILDAVWQTCPSATGRKAGFLQNFWKEKTWNTCLLFEDRF